MTDTFEPTEFAREFLAFINAMQRLAPTAETPLARELSEHLRTDPRSSPLVGADFLSYDHPNIEVAIQEYVAVGGRSHRTLGMLGPRRMGDVGLSDLLGMPFPLGPADYVERPIGPDQMLACMQFGVHLITTSDGPLAVLVAGPEQRRGMPNVRVEVMSPARSVGAAFLAELRALVLVHNVYRGQVISLSSDWHASLGMTFHRLPEVPRDAVVAPPGVLERIDRHTVGFSRHRDELLAAGRHLRRGLLLYGPPGTGKTLTVMHLVSSLPGWTVILVAGEAAAAIGPACSLARLLHPALLIVEDVDLIAEERTHPHGGARLLFQLLNEMDGLADDVDVVFVLTTNRVDLLEPALAARPGRVDLAVELPRPDAECRLQLLELYSRGLDLDVADWSDVIERTEGVTASFIKELLRKAALLALEDDGGARTVTLSHLHRALEELLVEGGLLTSALLGGLANSSP